VRGEDPNEDQGYDKVQASQIYHTSEVVIEEYGALAEENGSTWKETQPSAAFSTANQIWTALQLNYGLFNEKPVSTNLIYGMTILTN
jgi:hypothetical protein